MATLQFKGKTAVWNHHLSVPYHTLEKDAKKSLKGTDDAENLIIEGDNLLALKALLPQYQGKVKCIYIDPPYNTGNESWVYSDSVNSPTIKEWVGKVVGKEGEDLTRHDKWLAMMTPRLKLLRELLAEDGAIFVSIDDNEQHHLRILMDEVFGEQNFVADFIWKSKGSGAYDTKAVKTEHEYILCFAKEIEQTSFATIPFDTTQDAQYKYSDERLPIAGRYKRQAMAMGTLTYSKGLDYSLPNPDGVLMFPGGKQGNPFIWRWNKKKLEKAIQDGFAEWVKTRNGWSLYSKQYERLDSNGSPIDRTIQQTTVITDILSRNGTQELQSVFGKKVFDYPKPSALIRDFIKLITNGNDIVLDSFAGSGTTAHAVLDLNKEDGGNRKFILVEMEDYADGLTAERVRHVIKGSKYKDGFTYEKLGPAIDADNLLAGKLPNYKEFAKYVYYLATGKNHPDESKIKEQDYFVGKADSETVYLLYKPKVEELKTLAITLDWAQETQKNDKGRKVVYAPACYLDDEMLDQYGIKFVSVPYNLFERNK